MSRKSAAMETTSYYINRPGGILLSRSGSLITIGCEKRGGFVEFELTPEVAHLVWHFLDGIPDARTCEECAP